MPGKLDAFDDDDRAIFELAQRDPMAARRQLEDGSGWIRDAVADPTRMIASLTGVEADRRVLADPGLAEMTRETLRESLRQGTGDVPALAGDPRRSAAS